jgi:DNA polymerase elongation subunit (family B)
MRVLAIDIETRPALVYTWSLWQPTIGIDQIVDQGGMMSCGYKWFGKSRVKFLSDHHTGHEQMVRRLWGLLDEADVVVHFNGRRFDVPHIQREFVELGLNPPSPFKQMDLLETVRHEFRFLSNKLANVSKQLGLEGKVEHEGFMLWRRCMDGDELAWARMRRYNIRDVLLLEEAYLVLRPWIRSHPSHAAFTGRNVCPKCGSARIEGRGLATLTTGRYQRLHCLECGAWSRSTQRIEKTAVVQIAS